MSVEPSEDAINNFISFTSSSRKEAIDFLKKSNLDTQRAINAYFEKPPSPYIESLAGQESGYSEETAHSYQNQDVPSFNIDRSDSPRGNDYKAPPSRPPSRLNNRNTTSFTSIGETNEGGAGNNTLGNAGQGLSLAEKEEEQMRQAVAMSLNQELAGQETGVTEAANTQFGRANRDHYDEDAWAMTLFSATPQEAIINPDPEHRKRVNDEPAFIRHSEQYQDIGPLITILHAIPIAREALLLRERVLPSYGYDKQWWNGEAINLSKIVSLTDSDHDENNGWDDVLYETQRLIAFLDSTERAFGSSDSLSSITWNQASTSYLDRGAAEFMENWQVSALKATPNNQLATVFSSLALKRPVIDDEDPIQKLFVTFDAEVSEDGISLYEALDATLWPDVGDELDDVWLDRIGEVFTMKLKRSTSQKSIGVKIPAVWYPDRYLDSCKGIALEFRKRKVETLDQINWLNTLRNRLTTSLDRFGSQVNNMEALALAADSAEIATKGNSTAADSEGGSVPTVHEGVSGEGDSVATALRTVSKRIEVKLQELEKRKQEAQETFRKHSKTLTEPTSPTEPPFNKYTLRGVNTLPHVTYVLKRRVPEKGTRDSDGEGEKPDEWQWWRISFSKDDAKARLAEATQAAAVLSSQSDPAQEQPETTRKNQIPRNADVLGYTARKVREIEVLRAAREESRSVLLVYANEHAVNFQESGLPPELQEFVDTDNKSFNDELQGINQDSSDDEPPPADSWPSWDESDDQRLDTANDKPAESHLPANVNVYDYEVSSFPDDQEPTNGSQEMQERRGSAFLGQATQGGLVPHHSMDQIPEEADEDGKDVNHIERVN